MTDEILKEASMIKRQIDEIEYFIYAAEGRWKLRLFNKPKKMGVAVSDYMKTSEYYEASPEMRDKIISLLKQEKERLEKEYKELA